MDRRVKPGDDAVMRFKAAAAALCRQSPLQATFGRERSSQTGRSPLYGGAYALAATRVCGIDRTNNEGRSMTTTKLERLDLNTASTVHLRGIKGLGPSRAEEIVRYRSKHGPFTSIDELDRVPHVGDMPPQELAKVKQQFTLATGEGRQKLHKVNVNRANGAELRHVPGIGAAHAEAIVQHRREHGAIRDLKEIDELPHFRDQSTMERQHIKEALEV
jgi:competence ComEA-like helix-hairpin-helix protein